MTTVIDIREAGDADRDRVGALVAACSPASLRRRFLMGGPAEPAEVFRRYQRFLLAGPPAGAALLAFRDGTPVGLLNFVSETPGTAEIGVLVADAWQRQGIGSALSRWLWASGRWPGWTVRATVQAGNTGAEALLLGQGFRPVPSYERGERDFALAVPDWAIMTDVMKEAADDEDAARADGAQRRATGADPRCRGDRHAGRGRARRSPAGLPAALLPGR
ncbi:GNAT superfamily N-acetyltransferase [Amycolatopsis lexingtonensis]|uniref:GNAT superfamily N-acetyltransferase n=1 Tax=Amycolatopsis lexingtonensis TaxID=218822 RepID=A0ABR9HTU2_9PSEU|nr:GNAT family N-acetyltransferase [Amycolatopsis lexingtonensis]MBE1494342.1 GNAT superfamily N-acetyltransferase [Amycolatopsis lexingtonensis]